MLFDKVSFCRRNSRWENTIRLRVKQLTSERMNVDKRMFNFHQLSTRGLRGRVLNMLALSGWLILYIYIYSQFLLQSTGVTFSSMFCMCGLTLKLRVKQFSVLRFQPFGKFCVKASLLVNCVTLVCTS